MPNFHRRTRGLVAATAATVLLLCFVAEIGGATGTTNSTADPCARILSHSVPVGNTSYLVFTPKTAIACVGSFNVSAETRKRQVDIVKSYLELYPFLDMAKNTTAPLWPSHVDLLPTLDAIAHNDQLTTEFAFQSAVHDALEALDDGHTYYEGKCFRQFWAMLPYLFTAGGVPAADLAEALDRFWVHGLRGARAANFTGFVVTKIDGLDPVDYILKQTKAMSISRAAETRFNYALASYSWYQGLLPVDGWLYFRTLLTAGMPDVLRLTLTDPATGRAVQVDAPWAVVALDAAALASAGTYYAKYCTAAASTAVSRRDEVPPATPLEGVTEVTAVLPKELVQRKVVKQTVGVERLKKGAGDGVGLRTAALASAEATRTNDGIDLNNPLVSSNDTAFYMMNGSVGVWVMSTFSPSTSDDDYIGTITAGLTALERAGAKKLLIDVSWNGGGSICYSQALAQYLFPATPLRPVEYDVRATTVLQELYRVTIASNYSNSLFSLGGMLTLNGTQSQSFDDIYVPGVDAVRGGVRGKYSNKFLLDCSGVLAPYVLNATLFPQLQKGWDASNLVIVSNGLCLSSCAIFKRMLHSQYSVKAFTYGGHTGQVFAPSTVEGGQSTSAASVLTDVENGFAATNYTSPLPRDAFPSAFVLPSVLGIAHWEAYSRFETTGLPLDFEPELAEAHLVEVDGTDPVSVWTAAAAKL
ncbi:hypothetical protein DFJ73DRAFT_797047 [Zopfochytrium polystomum]|nr:hypothetical protein DFJ73DRAFT_797047 [Zopfochytrium polystomum]